MLDFILEFFRIKLKINWFDVIAFLIFCLALIKPSTAALAAQMLALGYAAHLSFGLLTFELISRRSFFLLA